MSSRRTVRQLLVAVLVGVLVGGGLMAVTPAGAEVSSALATNWKKIWKKEIRPRADKRYYTKKQTDGKYQPKGSYETAGSGYTKAETYSKAEADAKYQPKGSYEPAGSGYTKAESDGKYVPIPTTYRGSFLAHAYVPAAGEYATADIAFPVQLKVAPTVHVIDTGVAPPVGCSGNAAAPGASPGNLCIFVSGKQNVNGYYTCKGAGTSCAFGATGSADPWGLTMYAVATAAGRAQAYGSWALNPGGTAGVSTTRTDGGSLTTPDRGSPASTE
jgi:hypothetical protein